MLSGDGDGEWADLHARRCSSPGSAGRSGAGAILLRGVSGGGGGLILGVEFLSDGLDLAALELGEADPAPALGGASQGAEHELEHRAFAEGVRDGFSRRHSSKKRRSRRLVVWIARWWVTGVRSWTMQASKSSWKQAAAEGRSLPKSSTTSLSSTETLIEGAAFQHRASHGPERPPGRAWASSRSLSLSRFGSGGRTRSQTHGSQ